MARFGGSGRRRSFGTISAMLFNLSLFAMPAAFVNAYTSLQSADVYGYEITDAAKAETRRALEDAAGTLIPADADRKTYWSSLVQREIDEGDFPAARGFLLSTRTMLPANDASRIEAQLTSKATDEERIKTALVFLDDDVRKQYEANASPLAQAARAATDAMTGAATGDAKNPAQMAGAVASDFSVLGDLRDIGIQSASWVRGEPVDVFVLTLSGVGLALSAATVPTAGAAAPVKTGASVIKLAKRTGKLSARFSAHIEQRLFEAVPPQRLKQELTTALSNPGASESASIVKAFENSVDPAGYKVLTSELTDIKGISDAVQPSGALRLLEHAQDATDLKRLRLVAVAGGDRSVAVAKRAGGLKLLKAAKGTLKMTKRLTLDFGAFGLAVFGFVLAVSATLAQALLHAWRGHDHHPDDVEEDDEDDHPRGRRREEVEA